MPTSPPSRCTDTMCRKLATYRGRCEDHQPPAWVNRSKAWGSGSTRKRRSFRAQVLADEPRCRVCGAEATEVDHIVPLSQGGSKWDKDNVQALCHNCHDRKSGQDRRRPRRPSRLTY